MHLVWTSGASFVLQASAFLQRTGAHLLVLGVMRDSMVTHRWFGNVAVASALGSASRGPGAARRRASDRVRVIVANTVFYPGLSDPWPAASNTATLQ